ncbi:MAG TPA: hypothetical protein VLT84_04160 [Acidobacteriota bacterium]|nr:hypothetical protein [Acidobacteriota bacterium]
MRAWRCDGWTRIARDRTSLRFALSLLVLAAILVIPAGAAVAQTKATTDSASADESGIVVRVREEGTSRTTTIERAREKAAKAAERAADMAARSAQGIPEPPEPPDLPNIPDFDHSEGNDLVRFGEDIEIPEGRVIEGDVVAIGGSVTVLGRVKGDCVAVGGTVHIKGKGVVEGDAVSLGGGVQTSDSASVGGSDVSVGKFDFGRMGKMMPAIGAVGVLGIGGWLIEFLVGCLITIFVAWLSLLLLRDRLEHAASRVHERFGMSFLKGLLGWVALVLAVPVGIIALILTGAIAIVILCITIIGIPVAVLLVIALVLGVIGIVAGAIYAAFLGYITGAMFLGRRILGSRVLGKPLLAIAAGVILIGLLDFAGEVIGAVSFFAFHPVGMAFGFAAALLGFIVATAGLGTLVSVRFGTGKAAGVSGYGAAAGQWGATTPPPPPPHAAAPAPQHPTVTPPPDGSSDAP